MDSRIAGLRDRRIHGSVDTWTYDLRPYGCPDPRIDGLYGCVHTWVHGAGQATHLDSVVILRMCRFLHILFSIDMIDTLCILYTLHIPRSAPH